jgi:two-component system LytT family sensor kinase
MALRRTHWLAALNVGGWTVFGAVVSALFESPEVNRVASAAETVCLGILISAFLRRFYLATQSVARPVTARVLAACAASTTGALIWWAVDLFALQGLLNATKPAGRIFTGFATNIVFCGLPLLGWSFLYFAVEDWLSWTDQEERLAEARALSQTAQLQMLRYQLNPHFLFNALNSIRALIDEDPSRAREMITELSGFLSYSLESTRCPEVPLRVELLALDHYFAVLKKRYENKLEVCFEIDSEAREAHVLSFLVHPIVENAVKFGMSTSPMPLRIRVGAQVDGDTLVLTVSNTGRWVSHAGNGAGTSTGLENVKLRLENACPGRHSCQSFEKDGWVHVKLQMPVMSGVAHETTGHGAGRG